MQLLRKWITEGIGWTGATFSLSAFSLGTIGSQSVEYLLMNIIASFS